MQGDYLIRATAQGVRAFAAITTELTEAARFRHNCSPVASAALGRLMTASLLLAANLKTQEAVTIRIAGDGPLGECIADATAAGTVRGFVKNPNIDLPLRNGKLDVGSAVGKGNLYVTRFTNLKQPFTGTCELVSGEIAEDITQYLLVSEQTASSVALGVLVNPDMTVAASGGFLIQALPDAPEETLDIIEKNLKSLAPVTTLINQGYSAEMLVNQIFAGLEINIHPEILPLSFACTCSRQKVADMLITLGKTDLQAIYEEDGSAEICCHFCAEKYYFKREELKELLKLQETSL